MPKLVHCLKMLQLSADSALNYAKTRDENHLKEYRILVVTCQRLKEATQMQLEGSSESTRAEIAAINPNLLNQNDVHQYTQGSADSRLSLFDD